jgi:hypothetical protein
MIGTRYASAMPTPACAGSIRPSYGRDMKGDQDKRTAEADADVKDSRRDRLKLALRENLKRRKLQVRGRSDAAPSEIADACLDDAGGDKPGQ